MFENFGLEISKIFKNAELIRYDLRHPYVGSEHLLLAILKENDNICKILKKYNITYNNFKKELLKIVGSASVSSELNLYTPLLKRIIENATLDAKENNLGVVTTRHLLISMLEEGEGIALRILLIMDVDIECLYSELKNEIKSNNNFQIDYGIVLNEKIDNDEKIICRDSEIERIIETLLRHKKNNPLLVGKAGVGKTAIVEELARRINKKQVPYDLINTKIVMLEMGNLISGTKYRGEFEEKLTKIIEKAINNNIILFIDEIHSMVNAGSADGAISASDILKPYLARGDIKIIGATTLNEYNKYFLKDKALCRRFEKILIEEPNEIDTKNILNSIKNEYEKYHHIKISKKNIDEIVTLADKYIYNKCNPDKSIELLDSICAKVKTKCKTGVLSDDTEKKLNIIISQKNEYIKNNYFDKALECKELEEKIKSEIDKNNPPDTRKITHEDILKVIEEKTAIPLTKDRKTNVIEICKDLEKNIIGQQEAIEKIKINLLNEKNKIKSMLFIGSSGIGKTSMAKIIGKKYNFIKIDMNEFNKENSISKLIGVNPGYEGYDSSYVFETIREKPYSLILLDEIEKACPKVLNLFLNILDEGTITDSHNEVINFNNCIIIATGNIKSEKALGFGNNKNNFDKSLSRELIARFDDIIEFKTLEYKDVFEYIHKKYDFSENEINEIINKSDYVKYGLRNIENLVREKKVSNLFKQVI